MITQERLKSVITYDKYTGKLYWISRRGKRAGSMDCKGYVNVCIDGKIYYAHRLAWLYEYGYMPEDGIDHVDRNTSNNSINNLRVVNKQCNSRNTGNRADNTSGVKGVSWDKKAGQWVSKIQVNYKTYYITQSQDFDEAVCARLAAEQAEDWSGCDSSSPAYKYVQDMLS